MTPIPSTPVQAQRGTDERERLMRLIERGLLPSHDDARSVVDMLRADAEQLRALEMNLDAMCRNEERAREQLRARDEEIAGLRKDAKRLNYLDGLRWSSWNQTYQSTDNIKTNVAWMIVSPNVGCGTIREAIDELQEKSRDAG